MTPSSRPSRTPTPARSALSSLTPDLTGQRTWRCRSDEGDGTDDLGAHRDRGGRRSRLKGGANVIRFPVSINGQTSTPGSEFGGIDPIFEYVRYFNTHYGTVEVLPDIASPAPLASPQPNSPYGETRLERYRALVKYIALKFGQQPEYGLKAIETFNEPNLRAGWDHYEPGTDNWIPPTPEQLADAVYAAYEGVVAARDAAQVATPGTPARLVPLVLPGMSPFGFDVNDTHDPSNLGDPSEGVIDGIGLTQAYLSTFNAKYPSVPKSVFAANSLHLYANNTPEWGDYKNSKDVTLPGIRTLFNTYMTRMRERVTTQGFPSSEWITEVGFPSGKRNMTPPPDGFCGIRKREMTSRVLASRCSKAPRKSIARQYSNMLRAFMYMDRKPTVDMFHVVEHLARRALGSKPPRDRRQREPA